MNSCIICEKNDWENVDSFRIKPSGMMLCKSCGFVSYPELTQESLKEYYRKEYRKPPTISNLHSGQKKLQYHKAFLSDVLTQAKTKSEFNVFEVGAAYGLFLWWLKKEVPSSNVDGSELTLSFRRNAFHEFGLRLREDFKEIENHYDLICSYKVGEHQLDFDQELEKYKKSLKKYGLLYISVPIWFGCLNNFGAGGFDIEYYYHKNHVNVWARRHFESLLAKNGFKKIKENHSYYDSTYLFALSDESVISDFSGWADQSKKDLASVQAASQALEKGDMAAAVQAWPFFPHAWSGLYEKTRAQLHAKGFEKIQEEFVEPMLQACGDHAEAVFLAADISFRYSQWGHALALFDRALQLRPDFPPALMQIGHIYRILAKENPDPIKKAIFRTKARDAMRHLKEVSLQSYGEAVNWAYADNAEIPADFE